MRLRLTMLFLIGLMVFAGCRRDAAPFSDDFSDHASGWPVASTESYQHGYISGEYEIRLDEPGLFVWTTIGRQHTDVTLEVQVRSEGTPDNHFGPICRLQNEDFYYFAVSADGYYAIFRHSATGLAPLTGPAMLRSTAIRREGPSNRLLAVCEDSELALYVNGEQVARVEIPEEERLSRGDVGLGAGTVRRGQTTIVRFDNFAADIP